MSLWLHFGFAAAILAGSPAVRQEEKQEDIEALILKLGAEDQRLRDEATAELVRKGEKVGPMLLKALQTQDPEIRGRVQEIMDRIRKEASLEWILGRGRIREARIRGNRGGDPANEESARTEETVLAALKWLSRHQSADGSWSATGHDSRCGALPQHKETRCTVKGGKEDWDAGVSGLSLLSFVGYGYSHLSKETHDTFCFGDVVRKSIQWMILQQDAEGCIGSRKAAKFLYNHAICSLALSEAYALTGSKLFEEHAQKAADFLVSAQNPGKGWRYSPKCGDNDTSVTFWALLALRSSWDAGLKVPEDSFKGALAWFDEITNPDHGRSGYMYRDTGKVFFPGVNESFEHHETLTAAAVFHRRFLGAASSTPSLVQGTNLLLRDRPRWNDLEIDFYYWHIGSLALFQQDGPDGERWKTWNESMTAALIKNQQSAKEGCRSGSWEPVDRWSADGGRVYATAINALTLETRYRYSVVPSR